MKETARATSILIAGCGSIGRRHARVLRSLGIQELWTCDPASASREALAAETAVTREFDSFQTALAARPDAVFICTPPKLHVSMSIHALNSGAHVFCEKPLSDCTDGLDALSNAIKRSGKTFMVGFCFRYHAGLLRAKSHLDAGRIGRLVSIRCRMGEHLPTVRPDYKSLFTTKYSGAFDLTHEVDLACWFAQGLPVTQVKTIFGKFSEIDMDAPDLVELLVRFGNSCLASVHLDFFSQPRSRVTELLGTEGSISVEFSRWDRCTVSVYEADREEWEAQTLQTQRDDMFRSENQQFLDALATGKTTPLDLDEAQRSLDIIVAAQASA